MQHDPSWRARWPQVWAEWQTRLERAGLGGVARALADGLRPLAPLAAQALCFAQPGFALFGQSAAVDALAEILDSDRSQPTHGG